MDLAQQILKMHGGGKSLHIMSDPIWLLHALPNFQRVIIF